MRAKTDPQGGALRSVLTLLYLFTVDSQAGKCSGSPADAQILNRSGLCIGKRCHLHILPIHPPVSFRPLLGGFYYLAGYRRHVSGCQTGSLWIVTR